MMHDIILYMYIDIYIYILSPHLFNGTPQIEQHMLGAINKERQQLVLNIFKKIQLVATEMKQTSTVEFHNIILMVQCKKYATPVR